MKIKYPSRIIRVIKYITSPVNLAMVWVENGIFRNENHKYIVTNSHLVKSHVMKYFSVPEGQIKVIYDGVDHSLFNRGTVESRESMRKTLAINESDFVILFVANNWPRKGLGTILKALPCLSHDSKLVVVGMGKPARFIRKIRELGITQRVIFFGPTKEVQKFYGMSDVFVLPTMYDPCANVCREAMACGLPVITTKANGASEMIEHGENGYVLNDWRDYETLAEYLAKLGDPLHRKKMVHKACEAVEIFTWQRNVEEHLNLFRELTDG